MALTDDDAIEWLALRVIDRTLPKTEWTHAGHFAAAFWLHRNRPDLTTPEQMRALITGYNEATNTPNTDTGSYHHTITLASIRAAASHYAIMTLIPRCMLCSGVSWCPQSVILTGFLPTGIATRCSVSLPGAIGSSRIGRRCRFECLLVSSASVGWVSEA